MLTLGFWASEFCISSINSMSSTVLPRLRIGADLLAVGDIIRHGIAIDLNSTCVFISFKNHYFTKNLDCFSHIVTLFTTTFQSFLINH